MADHKKPGRHVPSLDDRFIFVGDAVAPGDQAALKPALYEVEDRANGAPRCLKLWRKTGSPVDTDLRELWRHEMRQLQRVMSYAGAQDIIVDILEFVEDADYFGVLLERAGHPLAAKKCRVHRHHWLHDLTAIRARTLFWKNVRRVATALGIVHRQGLVHGRLSADVIMTEGAEEPDFQLGGFEWSLWFGAEGAEHSHAKLGAAGAAQRADTYSFAEDWRALGYLIADCLGVRIESSGKFVSASAVRLPIVLNGSERALLKRLTFPTRFDLLDAPAVVRSIDDIVANIAQAASVQPGTFILGFTASSGLGKAVYDASDGEIAIDEFNQQLDWIRADLDTGAKLLVPRSFDPADTLRVVTEAMMYRLRAFRHEDGSATWDIAVCVEINLRANALNLGTDIDHVIDQSITVAKLPTEAGQLRARLGPDVLDWSILAGAGAEPARPNRADGIRQALVLIQVTEAVVKALECYPIEVLDAKAEKGRRFVTIRAEPDNDRDRLAKQVGMSESATALRRLFEEDARDAEGKWRISLSPSLGASRFDDLAATFVEPRDHAGRSGYQFEIDDELPPHGPYFLRAERDTGTERVISRRLRNIKALDTRIDLVEMLENPWRVRRSSRETLDESDRSDAAFRDLDEPKQEALLGLWSTLPSYFVVGPPGVGKTKLATETVRRRFYTDRSARLLVSAQGHDALDHLQKKITETLDAAGMNEVIVVRTTTPDRRPTSEEEAHLIGLDYLDAVSRSEAFRHAPQGMRDRIATLKAVAQSLKTIKNAGGREERSGLHAISSLVLDGANIVISTANSPDIETMVASREQFDWVIVEEAAKATGPELVGPLMLSGRRLLIGDHHQLPPFEADRLGKILADFSLITATLTLAPQLVGSLMREGELEELERIARDPTRLRETGNLGRRLLEPFRTFAEEDERLSLANSGHRAISAMLTEQRRMDPAIARIISEAFYKKKLKTNPMREAAATELPPFVHLAPMPSSPVVVVDFPHVSASGTRTPIERGRPRWHNPSEVDAVINVLRRIRARRGASRPSLAILSPYSAQVDMLDRRVEALRRKELAHLDEFASVRSGGGFVGTVDSFQGGEADLVIVSLVRNNPRTGGAALGFLRDRRRINVALSRAKSQLVLVGSLDFLRDAVRGVNPDDESHDLAFLTQIVDTIATLSKETRGSEKLPLAAIVAPAMLGGQP
jgi:hypothetical protein